METTLPHTAPTFVHHVCLVAETPAVRKDCRGRLLAGYAVRLLAPTELLSMPGGEREHLAAGAAAVLIEWNAAHAAVLEAVRNAFAGRPVPVLALCADDESTHVEALLGGADYILPYPLAPLSLAARLLAYRRRAPRPAAPPGPSSGAAPLTHDVCRVGPLLLDRTALRFYVDGTPLGLTPREHALVGYLMERAGACCPRHDILDAVWGIDFDTGTNLLDVHVYALRRKLRPHGADGMIETVRGIGYRLIHPTQ